MSGTKSAVANARAELDLAEIALTNAQEVLNTIDRPFRLRREALEAEHEAARSAQAQVVRDLQDQRRVAAETLNRANAAAELAKWSAAIPESPQEIQAFVRARKADLGLTVDTWDLKTVVRAPVIPGGKVVVRAMTDQSEHSDDSPRVKCYLAFDTTTKALVGWMTLDIEGHRGGSTRAMGRVNGQAFLRRPYNHYAARHNPETVLEFARPVYPEVEAVQPLAQFQAALGGKALVLSPEPKDCKHGEGSSGQEQPNGDMVWTCGRCGGTIPLATLRACQVCGNDVASTYGQKVRGHEARYYASPATKARVADHDAVPGKVKA